MVHLWASSNRILGWFSAKSRVVGSGFVQITQLVLDWTFFLKLFVLPFTIVDQCMMQIGVSALAILYQVLYYTQVLIKSQYTMILVVLNDFTQCLLLESLQSWLSENKCSKLVIESVTEEYKMVCDQGIFPSGVASTMLLGKTGVLEVLKTSLH